MTTSWGRIALLYAIGVLAAGQLGIVPPLVPALQRDLGLSLATAGMTVSIVTLVGAVLGLPAGSWCERIGHGRALGIGILIMGTAAALCAAADAAATLLAARGLAGIGYLLVVVAVPSLMAAIAAPRHHAFTLSLWGTFVPAGMALGGTRNGRICRPRGLAHDVRRRRRPAGPRLDRRPPDRAAGQRAATRRRAAVDRRAGGRRPAFGRLLLLRPAFPRARRVAAGLSGRASRARDGRGRTDRRHCHCPGHCGQSPRGLAHAARLFSRPSRRARAGRFDRGRRPVLRRSAARAARRRRLRDIVRAGRSWCRRRPSPRCRWSP